MVKTLDLNAVMPEFESHPNHYIDFSSMILDSTQIPFVDITDWSISSQLDFLIVFMC